jgi:dephospho-CoA kinase
MLLVGLTGGIGSGKTVVSDSMAQLGAEVVDTDVISRVLTGVNGPALPAIAQSLGMDLIDPATGSLDRVRLRRLVFSDGEAKRRLEHILHPMIAEQARRQIDAACAARGKVVLLVVPLLVETLHWLDQVDRILVVDASPEVQMKRLLTRPGMHDQDARRIIGAQARREVRLASADDVIANDGNDRVELDRCIEAMFRRYQCWADRSRA